jgi:ribonuclease HII
MAKTRRARSTLNRLTLGIDEAGRGPALGPMVMAAVAIDTRAAAALSRAGLRDSKSYGAGDDAHEIRSTLAVLIRERAVYVKSLVAPHSQVDERVARHELNLLERELATELIDAAPEVDRIIADGKRMFAPLGLKYGNFESRDHGEDHHAAVAAASVIAKVLRDELFATIRSRYEPEFGAIAGGGYANAATRKFLCAYAERYRCLPDEARRTWPYPYISHIIGDVRPQGAQMEMTQMF